MLEYRWRWRDIQDHIKHSGHQWNYTAACRHLTLHNSCYPGRTYRSCWLASCDPVRTELVCRGPYQTSPDFTFPKRDDGRSCHHNHFYRKLVNGEKIKRSWLVYSRKNNTLYCFCCKLFSQKNDHLIRSGLNDWKNCSEVFEIFCSGTYSIHKSTFVCRGYS